MSAKPRREGEAGRFVLRGEARHFPVAAHAHKLDAVHAPLFGDGAPWHGALERNERMRDVPIGINPR